MRSRTYLVDLDKKNYQVAKYKQYDNNIDYSIHLVESGIDVPLAGCTVFALFRRKDGKAFQKNCTIKDSVITTKLDNNILELDGIVKSEFRIYKGDMIVTTFSITINVEDSINIGDAIDSVPGADLIGTIMDLQKEIEDARGGENSLKDKLDKIEDNIANHTHPYAGSDTHGGSANSAKKLVTPRKINGTDFDGTQDIVTQFWGAATSLTVGNTPKLVDGSQPIRWTLDEIGATPKDHTHSSNQITNLNGYHNAYMNVLPISANDTLNVALEKLETGIEFQEHQTNEVIGLRGYNKGNHKGALTTNDSLNIALAKLENGIEETKNNSLPSTGGNVTGNITAPSFTGDLIGNADSATKLKDARRINGTFFDGTRDIDTQYWGVNRGFKIGKTLKSVNGSRGYEWTLAEIGASAENHTHGSNDVENLNGYNKGNHNGALTTNDTLNTALAKLENNIENTKNNSLPITGGNVTGNITAPTFTGDLIGNADSSSKLKTPRKINDTEFDGTTDIVTEKWGKVRNITIGNTTKQVDGSGDVEWTLQEIGAGAGGGINTTYKTTINSNQWVANGTNYKFLVNHNLSANIVHVGAVHSTTNESILVPYKIINNNSLEVFTVDRNLSMNIVVISEALAAGGGGGGGITSITTNGRVYNAVGNNITLPNHLLLTGGTVTGQTNFNQGINCQAVSVFTGIRSEGINPATGFSYWSISAQGHGSFNNLQTSGETLFQGQVTTHRKMRGMAVDGSEAWSIERDGNASFESLKVRTKASFFEIESTQNPPTWSINDSGDGNLKSLTTTGSVNASGFIYGMNNIALGRGQVAIPQQAVGTVTANYMRMGNMVMASLDNNGGVYFTQLNGADAPHIHFGNNIKVGRGQLRLPHAGGTNVTTDYMRIGGANIAGVDSGNIHMCTNDGRFNTLYVSNIINTYSLNKPITRSNTSALDEINSVDVVNTSEGFRMTKTTRGDSKVVVETKVSEDGEDLVSIDSVSAISTLWKANQELLKKIESLQEEVNKLKGGN